MKKLLPFLGVCLMAFTINFSAPQMITVEGKLIDTKCYGMDDMNIDNTHKVPGKEDKMLDMPSCATACVNMGIPVGLLQKDGSVFMLVTPSNQLAEHMAKHARVTGNKVFDGGIIPEKIEVKDGDEWKEVQIGTMM